MGIFGGYQPDMGQITIPTNGYLLKSVTLFLREFISLGL
jgi:hypothetical protein